MRAAVLGLTVRQPGASVLAAVGVRSLRTGFGGRIPPPGLWCAILAARSDVLLREEIVAEARETWANLPEEFPRSVFVAVAEVVEIVDLGKDGGARWPWESGSVEWRFGRIYPIEPPVALAAGPVRQRAWEIEPDVKAELRERIRPLCQRGRSVNASSRRGQLRIRPPAELY